MKLPLGLRVRFAAMAVASLSISAVVLHAQYDLVVTNIGNTVGVDQGAWVFFSATIQNRGDAPTPAGVIHGVSFWVDGRAVSWSDNWSGPLAPGESVVVQANGGPFGNGGLWAGTFAGSHDVFAWVDDINRLPDEADENNNILATTMTIQGDIARDVDVVAPTGLGAGESVYFTALIEGHNGDPTLHVRGAAVTFFLDGSQLCTSSRLYVSSPTTVPVDSRYRFLDVSGQNGVGNDNGTWIATPGTHTIEARTGGVVPTSVSKTFVVEGIAAPDLVVDAVFGDAPQPGAGGEVLFHATIRNAGTAATPAGVILGVSFWVDGQAVSWSDTIAGPLAPGASVTVTANGGPFGKATWTAQSGEHNITAWVDDIDRIPGERDENNNTLSITQTFSAGEAGPAAAPDLVVVDVFSDFPSAKPGDEVFFHATIRNTGNAPTLAGVIHGVSFWIDGQAVSWSDTFVGSLAPGESVVVTSNWGPFGKSTWTATSGEHVLAAWVDDINRMPGEQDEDNNITETVADIS